MIKESIQQTIRLIETIQKVSPTDYQDKKYELDSQHACRDQVAPTR